MRSFEDLGIDIEDPMESLFAVGHRARPAPAAYRRAMPEDQANSMSQSLLNAGKGGLSQIFAALNKPGRAARGLLGGSPQEALAILPFSDTLGITDPKNEVTGAKLNEKLGLKDDNSWTSWGAGLATEIATDPLTYATFGAKHALTPAGIAAKKAGTLKNLTRKEAVEQSLGQMAKIKLPFLPEVGTGRLGAGVAGAIDTGIDKALYKNPVGRHLVSNFYYPAHRALSEIGQKAMAFAGEPAAYAVEQSGRNFKHPVVKTINDLLAANPHWDPTEVSKAFTMRAEGITPSSVLPVDPEIWEAMKDVGDAIATRGDMHAHRAEVLGSSRGRLADQEADYKIRRINSEHQLGDRNVGPLKSRSLVSEFSGSHVQRKNPLRDVPGGTEMLQKWGVEKPSAIEALDDMIRHVGDGGRKLATADYKAMVDKAKEVSNYFQNLPVKVTPGKPLFSRHIGQDIDSMIARQARTERNLEASYEGLKMMAKPGARAKGPLKETITLPAAMKILGLRTTPSQQGAPMAGALVQMAQKMGIDPSPWLHGPNKDLSKVLKSLQVSKADLEKFMKDYAPWQMPEELKGPRQWGDSITNSFRNLAYSIWPASQTRNLMGGAVQTAARSDRGPAMGMIDTVRDLVRQTKIMRGTAADADIEKWTGGRFKSLDDYRRAQFADADLYSGHGISATELSSGPASLGQATSIVGPTPGEGFVGGTGSIAGDLGQLMGSGLKDTALRIRDKARGKLDRPLFEMQGVRHLPVWENTFGNLAGLLRGERPKLRGAATEGSQDFPWLEMGRRLGYNIESLLRGGQHLGKTREGFAPAQIADEIWKTHFAYNRLTPFEKNVMRRVVPFYTFTSRNLPLQLENLTTKPGNTMPWLRMSAARDPNQFIPRHIAGGIAMPLGQEDSASGQQQFLSQMGLPIEEFAERFKFDQGAPDVKGTVAAYAGALNPLIKGPLEWLFDKQLYSGRKLSDLKPQGVVDWALNPFADEDTQGLMAQALANSPMTRVVSTLDKITDPRKSWWQKAVNLGTGLRITDVDMPKMRAVETRQALEELLRRNPRVSQYTNFYVRPEDKVELTPEDTEKLQLLSRLQSNAQRHSKMQRMQVR